MQHCGKSKKPNTTSPGQDNQCSANEGDLKKVCERVLRYTEPSVRTSRHQYWSGVFHETFLSCLKKSRRTYCFCHNTFAVFFLSVSNYHIHNIIIGDFGDLCHQAGKLTTFKVYESVVAHRTLLINNK